MTASPRTQQLAGGAITALLLAAVVVLQVVPGPDDPTIAESTLAPVMRDVAPPDTEGDRIDLEPLTTRTNSIVVAVRDGEANFVNIDAGNVLERTMVELWPGDPPYRLVDGERLVFYGGDTLYALDGVDASPEPIVDADSFAVFVPAGVRDRVWLRVGRTDGARAAIRQVDLAGRTLLGPTMSPGGNLAIGLRDSAVLQRAFSLIVWNPATDEILQEVEGKPMGTDGTRFAWCKAFCSELYLSNPGIGTTDLVATLAGGSVFHNGRISHDGRYLATTVCGFASTCAVAVLDLYTDQSWTVGDGWVSRSTELAWSPDSRWVFATVEDGGLAAYQPGDAEAFLVSVSGLDPVYGLGVMPSSDSPSRGPRP